MSETSAPQPFAVGPWRGLAVPEVESVVRDLVARGPEAVARAGTVLRESRYRVTARVETAVGPLLLKAHRVRRRGESWGSLVRRSRARAEWDAAWTLAARGVRAPAALAFGERRRGGRLREAFLLTSYLAEHAPFRRAFAEARIARRGDLARAVGRFVRRMHDAGFDHRDLHAENLLVGPFGAGDLVVVDLHRHRVGGPVPPRARVRALGRLLHDLGPLLGPGGRFRMLVSYAGADGRAAARRLARGAAREGARIERVRVKSRAKRCFLESTVYTRDVGRRTGARRRDLPLDRLERALREHEEAIARRDDRVVKVGRKSRLTRHGDVVVKETFPAGLVGRAKDLLAPRRRRAGYQNAHLLTVLGVDTARPLAWVHERGRDYVLYDDLTSRPRLDVLARERYLGRDRAVQVRLRDASAAWIASLHARGVYHGDLKGVNVRVAEDGASLRFFLVDTDRVRRFAHPVDRRRRVKNLAQLAASIAVVVTRTERLRWYRRYAARVPPAEERETAREVARALAPKILVVDEPLE